MEMGSILEGLFRCRVMGEESSSSSSNPTDAVIFVAVCLVLGIACRQLLQGTRVPYTVALLIIGIALGSLGLILDIVPLISLLMLKFIAY